MRIVSREAWGAAPPKGVPGQVIWPSGVDLWVHHTAGPPTQTPKQIQAFHQNSRGWNDVGYGYLIDEAGTVYEGRGYEVMAAHSPGVNHQPSVALIGTYEDRDPTEAQRRAVWALRDHIKAGRLRGHKENTSTSCPGSRVMAKIVKAPRPLPPAKPKPTLRERLMAGFRKAGFGGKSAKQATDAFFRGRK